MRADDRVFVLRHVVANDFGIHRRALPRRGAARAIFLRRGVDRPEAFERRLETWREDVPRRILAREHGVTPDLRHFDGVEDGAERGLFQEAHVRVPAAAKVYLL